ncbi:MAG: hypothetical protein H6811_04650 [Phycisphaeraceae bacterium]|nr:hypothetical protein [Phycisphaeraceae bacterium]
MDPFHHRRRLALLLLAAVSCLAISCDLDSGGRGAPLRVIRTLGEGGLSPGQFNYPRAIDAGLGSLWVIDKSARIQRLDPETGECQAWFTMPEFELGKPTGVTIAPGADGEPLVYIPDTHYHRVMVYRPPSIGSDSAELVSTFGSYGQGRGEFVYPTDVAVLTDVHGNATRIYVSEYGGNDRISVFDPRVLQGDDGFLFSFGHQGDGPGVEFDRPQSIAISRELGELIVCDAINQRIGRFTLDGDLVSWIGPRSTPSISLDYPYGLLVMDDGVALVSEFGASRVQRLDLRTGSSLAIDGRPGRGPGELSTPWGVAWLNGAIFVLDSGNNRICAFRSSGAAGPSVPEMR